MVRWLRWHCPPDTGFEIRTLAVWGRARYLSVTEAPHNTDFHTWMGKKHFCFFQTAETGNRTPNSGVKGSGANHYPRAPALIRCKARIAIAIRGLQWMKMTMVNSGLKGLMLTAFLLITTPYPTGSPPSPRGRHEFRQLGSDLTGSPPPPPGETWVLMGEERYCGIQTNGRARCVLQANPG